MTMYGAKNWTKKKRPTRMKKNQGGNEVDWPEATFGEIKNCLHLRPHPKKHAEHKNHNKRNNNTMLAATTTPTPDCTHTHTTQPHQHTSKPQYTTKALVQ